MSSSGVTDTPSLGEMVADVVDLGLRTGRDLLSALRSDDPSARTLGVVRRGVRDLPAPRLPALPGSRTCGCDIPAPCWMPRELGVVKSHGCPGTKAVVRLNITNCGLGRRTVRVAVAGKGSDQVKVSPDSVDLGTYERGSVTAALTFTDQMTEPLEVLVWVQGCRDHVLRWRLEATEDGCASLHEVDVEDCPDLVHHWYDHFYCERPCTHSDRKPRG